MPIYLKVDKESNFLVKKAKLKFKHYSQNVKRQMNVCDTEPGLIRLMKVTKNTNKRHQGNQSEDEIRNLLELQRTLFFARVKTKLHISCAVYPRSIDQGNFLAT